MRKNRRTPKRLSVVATRTTYFVAIIVALFVMVMLDRLADSRCTQLMDAIGRNKKELANQQEACERESLRWEETKATIETVLVNRAMDMDVARPDQIVHMNADGMPRPGQLAVKNAMQRMTRLSSVTGAGVRRPKAAPGNQRRSR